MLLKIPPFLPKARLHLLVCVLSPASVCCEAEAPALLGCRAAQCPWPPEGPLGPRAAPLAGSTDLSWAAQLLHSHSRTSRAAASASCLLLEPFLRQGILSVGSDEAGWAVLTAQGVTARRDFPPGKRLHTADGFSGAAWQGHGLGRGEGNETPAFLAFFSPMGTTN